MGIVTIVSVSGRDDCQLCPIYGVLHYITHNGACLLDDWAVVIDVCHTHSHLRQIYAVTFFPTIVSLLVLLAGHFDAGLH